MTRDRNINKFLQEIRLHRCSIAANNIRMVLGLAYGLKINAEPVLFNPFDCHLDIISPFPMKNGSKLTLCYMIISIVDQIIILWHSLKSFNN